MEQGELFPAVSYEQQDAVPAIYEKWQGVSLNKGDVLLYSSPGSELTVVLQAIEDEEVETYPDNDSFAGDTTTDITTLCEVWIFNATNKYYAQINDALWIGRECATTCLQLIGGKTGLMVHGSVQEEIAAPQDGTRFIHYTKDCIERFGAPLLAQK